ncbi:MAG: hypothetical protein ABSH52_05295 [Terriglobia bacterium]|jgi:hypothetical protein
MDIAWLDYAIVAILGALVGSGELVSRYRDAPAGAIHTWPARFYILINIAASIAALFVIHVFNWHFGVTSGDAPVRWTQVGIAGTGAMALFRSSLFTVRVGDRDVAVGPISFLQVFRDAADREVDRLRARARSDSVADLMEGIDYRKAIEGLPPYCLALMQNVAAEDQQKMLQALALLDKDPTIDPAIKVRILGLQLMNVVGPNVLSAAVKSLRKQMEDQESGARSQK